MRSSATSRLSFLGATSIVLTVMATMGCEGPVDGVETTESAETVAPTTPLWSAHYASEMKDTVLGTGVDAAGNTYVAGVMGTGWVVSTSVRVIKYSSGGGIVYDKQLTLRSGTVDHFAVAPSGEAWLTGRTRSACASQSSTCPTGFRQTVALIKLGSNGSLAWEKDITPATPEPGAGGDLPAYVDAIAPDPTGGVVLKGVLGNAPLELGNATIPKPPPGTPVWKHPRFIVKVDGTGAHRWHRTVSRDLDGHSLAGLGVTTTGDVYVSGTGRSDFGAGPVGQGAFFVVKLSGVDGHPLWTGGNVPTGANLYGFTGPLAVLADGGVAALGYVRPGDRLDLGGGPIATNGWQNLPFVVRYDAAGAYQFGRTYPELGSTATGSIQEFPVRGGMRLAATATGKLVVTGTKVRLNAFDDLYKLSVISSGGVLEKSWTIKSHRGYLDFAGVAVTPSGRIVTTGTFWGQIQLGGGATFDTGPLPRDSKLDAFVAAFPL